MLTVSGRVRPVVTFIAPVELDIQEMDLIVVVSLLICPVSVFIRCINFVQPALVTDPCLSGPCDINAECQREGPLSTSFILVHAFLHSKGMALFVLVSLFTQQKFL